MKRFEHEPGLHDAGISEFLTRIKEREAKDVGIKFVLDEAERQELVIRGNQSVPAKRLTAYLQLTAAIDQDSIIYQELVVQAIIATEKDYAEFKEKQIKREKEILAMIQEKSPRTRIFSGRVIQEGV